MVHIHNGILLSHKRNAFESVLMRWMNPEPIIQSEVSQKEKNNYHILVHTYGIEKDGADESICRAAMETQILRMDLGGRRREWAVYRVMGTHITMCKLASQSESAVRLRECRSGSETTWWGGLGRQAGGRFTCQGTSWANLWLFHADVW